ncbi:hypothetical protein [Streptomyces sp. NPDC005573]|uniref:hypothetical protein n=1 Tax=Streptomyces sp. NPDC005573 TaxID=3156890 RepID=UPI0033BAF05A
MNYHGVATVDERSQELGRPRLPGGAHHPAVVAPAVRPPYAEPNHDQRGEQAELPVRQRADRPPDHRGGRRE